MIKSLTKYFHLLTVLAVLSSILFSCSSQKKVKYFQDIPDSGKLKTIPKVTYTDVTIQPGDVLNVTIQLIDPLASSTINSANLIPGGTSSAGTGAAALLSAVSGSSGGTTPSAGILVGKDGFLNVPIVGAIKAEGLTTASLRDTIHNRALLYYKQPTITVNFANFKINVVGEVLKPGQYVLPYEKATIFDALALAGDLTIFGKRENVLLVRTNTDGTKTPYRINLKNSDIMSEPYFYLHQNDFIYVEPRKAKSDATDAAQQKYITLAGALLSIILVLAYRAN